MVSSWAWGLGVCHCFKPLSSLVVLKHFCEFKVSQGELQHLRDGQGGKGKEMNRQVRPDIDPYPTSSSHCSDKAKLGVSYRGRGKLGSPQWTCRTPLCLGPGGDRNSQVLAQTKGSGDRLYLPSYPEIHPIPRPPWSTMSTCLTIPLPQGVPRGSPLHLNKSLAPLPSSGGPVTSTYHAYILSHTPASAQGPSGFHHSAQEAISKRRK